MKKIIVFIFVVVFGTNAHAGPGYALVAGGSKGIGYGIAEALAKRGYDLILIARHVDSLIAAKNKLESQYKIHVELLAFDLERDESAVQIAQWCTEKNIPLKMLCNVAGFGGSRDYLSLPLDTLRYMINLNIGSAMALTLTLLPLLEKNAPSYILNVGSMAGFAPIPVKNLYSATKSAVVFFSYSLRYQLKEKHISVSVLCPGPVFTKPEIEKDTKQKLGWIGEQMAISPQRVGEIAVKKTLHKRLVIVPGGVSKIMAFFVRFLPRRWVVGIYYRKGKNNFMKYALITGGSKGIGFGIAKALAGRNYHLVLVARNAEALENAKKQLEEKFHVTVHIICADLKIESNYKTIVDWCNENKIQLSMLCNVAGIGGAKDFLSVPLNDSLEMFKLNTIPAIALTYELLPLLKQNSPSYILNTSSMAGFSPIAVKNIYSASKSAILFFSYSLRRQLKNKNISVSCLCPGPVFTKPSIRADTVQKLGWLGKKMPVTADYTGEIAVKKTLERKMIIVPGVLARTISFLLRLLPSGFINFIS